MVVIICKSICFTAFKWESRGWEKDDSKEEDDWNGRARNPKLF